MALLTIRLDEDFINAIKAKANLEHGTVTDLVRKALVNYMNADINVQNEILCSLEQVNKSVRKSNENYALFHALFLQYLKYFFAFNKSEMDKWVAPSGNPKDTIALRQKMVSTGEKIRDDFIHSFPKDSKGLNRLIEKMFSDCLLEDAEERDAKDGK